jgi:hypothetical protein
MRFFAVAFLLFSLTNFAQKTPSTVLFLKGNGNQTATYKETIDYYTLLANDFSSIKIIEMGATDSGEPTSRDFNPENNLTSLKFKKTKLSFDK